MLKDLFRKARMTDINSVINFQRFVIIIFILLLSAIFGLLCTNLIKENPSVYIDFISPDKLPLPHYSDCSDYINKTIYIPASVERPYFGAFVSNYDANPKNGIPLITLLIYITDSRYSVSNKLSTMMMLAYDGDYGPSKFNDPPTSFENSLTSKNSYILSQPKSDINVYYWKFNRVIRKSIIMDILSYIGYAPNYKVQPYIESSIQLIPAADAVFNIYNQTINRTLYAVLQFFSDSSVYIREEKEQKNKSILGLLGLICGFWSAVTTFYVFLFGLGVISPWGFVQKNLFKNKYKEKLLPFAVDLQSDEPDIEENTNIKEDVNSSIQKRLDNLEKRVKLYENIIDISLLTSVEKNGSSP
ncbi:hypothetical protein F8M41_005173 [Gigaspora margarita]|uniref:Uncharacterized protein n=1 Tax=Gigaspora margarita TaxID=4874 RepID=A0A8H4A623_GIGMA|nr:hypothetical protein F8M41_005173 [Gigaspora margarita]